MDWIQLIQMGRRDAIIRLLAHDGKVGTFWCRGGDIIDATCDGVTGEEGVYSALTWIGGSVSVDFTAFSRRRAILTPTTALLLGAAYREDSAAHHVEQPQGLPAPPDEAGGAAGTALAVFSAPARWMAHRRPALLIGVTCGFLALLLTAGLSSSEKFRARPRSTGVTPSAHDLPVPTAVTPWYAALASPAGQVEVGSNEVPAGAFEQIRHPVPTRSTATNAMRRRPRATMVPAARGSATSSARSSASPESVGAPASVQIIEERPPRIQIIDERRIQADVRK
jgi:hypothetical protein